MNKLFLILLFFSLTSNTFAQKVPRPGGGGEKDPIGGGQKIHKQMKSFYKSFKQRLRVCDPNREVDMEFEKIFNYLLMRQMDSMLKKQPQLNLKFDDCSKESKDIIICILDQNIKKELAVLIKENIISIYLRDERGMTPRDIDDRIGFLNHLLDK